MWCLGSSGFPASDRIDRQAPRPGNEKVTSTNRPATIHEMSPAGRDHGMRRSSAR